MAGKWQLIPVGGSSPTFHTLYSSVWVEECIDSLNIFPNVLLLLIESFYPHVLFLKSETASGHSPYRRTRVVLYGILYIVAYVTTSLMYVHSSDLMQLLLQGSTLNSK